VSETPAWSIPPSGSRMTCIDYDPTGNFVAYSNAPGTFVVANALDGTARCEFRQDELQNAPITGLRFHRSDPEVILGTSKDGCIFLHNHATDRVLNVSRQLGNTVLCANVDSFGEQFAIGCSDGTIRIHDLATLQRTKVCVKNLKHQRGGLVVNIYSVCFHPEDSRFLLAAGWNDRVLFWDARTGQTERGIAGPHVRGDAIDMIGNIIVTASAREKRQIEFWDFGTMKRLAELAFDTTRCAVRTSCLLNHLKIARNEQSFVVGGPGAPCAQLFTLHGGIYIGQTNDMATSAVISAVSPFGSAIVTGGQTGEGLCHMVRVKPGTIL